MLDQLEFEARIWHEETKVKLETCWGWVGACMLSGTTDRTAGQNLEFWSPM
jgi:hypothetical protein